MLTLDGKTLQYDRAFTHDGISYPANWLRLTTLKEKQAIGIVEVADTSQSWDERFYLGVDTPKQLNDEALLDEDGNDTGKVQTGLKTLWKQIQNEIAASLLALSDWRVVKAAEVADYTVENEWLTYRAAVRTACNTRQTEINDCTDVAALKELIDNPTTTWPTSP